MIPEREREHFTWHVECLSGLGDVVDEWRCAQRVGYGEVVDLRIVVDELLADERKLVDVERHAQHGLAEYAL